ncbi:uncharacterized protein LOC128242997 [Mya arenaria]|uniref:uncharacterized protein LOC128242997 n=1 Tax=Mya arenaria TaxID=6604 RepID=UPI0022E95DF6|nr:uncharacterized protein LOC128242997 [Mya arenaria]
MESLKNQDSTLGTLVSTMRSTGIMFLTVIILFPASVSLTSSIGHQPCTNGTAFASPNTGCRDSPTPVCVECFKGSNETIDSNKRRNPGRDCWTYFNENKIMRISILSVFGFLLVCSACLFVYMYRNVYKCPITYAKNPTCLWSVSFRNHKAGQTDDMDAVFIVDEDVMDYGSIDNQSKLQDCDFEEIILE